MDSRNPAPPDQPPTPALLPRRVHLPVQPADLPSSGVVVLPVAPAGRRHRPAPPQRTHRRHRQRLGRIHKRLGANCTQADMQDACSKMIWSSWTPPPPLAAAEANEHTLITAETRRLQLAAHWADLHPGDAVLESRLPGA